MLKVIIIIIFTMLIGCKSKTGGTTSIYNDNSDEIIDEIQGCTDDSACNYNDDATIDDNSCFYTNCTNNSCDSDVCITITNVNHYDNNLDILMVNTIPVAGFQFNLEGIIIINASGGEAAVAGFSVSNSGNLILGFSMGGAVISSGDNILTQLSFTDYNPPLCIQSPIFSDQSGDALTVQIGGCYN